MNEIRTAQPEDIPQVLALLHQVAQIHHDIRPDIFKANVTKYTAAELEAILACESTPVFVSVSETGTVEGYAFCQIQEYKGEQLLEDKKTLYLDDLCVSETCRGRHIGSQLYEHVKEFAKEIGAESITLNVWEGNESALAFYRSLGMKEQRYTMEEKL